MTLLQVDAFGGHDDKDAGFVDVLKQGDYKDPFFGDDCCLQRPLASREVVDFSKV